MPTFIPTPFFPHQVQQFVVNNGAYRAELKVLAPWITGYTSSSVPERFQRNDGTMWHHVVELWLHVGISGKSTFIPKSNIDLTLALRHLAGVVKSRDVSYGTKVKVAAYLMSLWFEDFISGPDVPENFVASINAKRVRSHAKSPG